MDLSKCQEIFDPIKIDEDEVIIIGCGAIGSTVAVMLARMGVTHFTLYDMDEVNAHNLANQNYYYYEVGKLKTLCTAEHISAINPDVRVKCKGEYTNQRLSGYVFLCVDNIDTRRSICDANLNNDNIKYVFDFRMGLFNAQTYAANWQDEQSKLKIIDSMMFSHDEAKENTPVSPCGTTLNVITTVNAVVAAGCNQFIKAVNKQETKHLIVVDLYNNSLLTL